MSYAAAASLSETIEVLLSYHEESISPRLKDQMASLYKHVYFLQSFLEDFPDRANHWEETVREITDRAEEIIELLWSDSLLNSISTTGSSRAKLKMGKHELHYSFDELERVSEEIVSIAYRMEGRHTEAMDGSDDELEVFSRLCGGSSALEIISIFGSRGIGKTTLARNLYNHLLIVEHFEIRALSRISSNYSRWQIVLDLLHCMNKSVSGSISNSEDDLIESIRTILQGKRYLIVLDDIWSLEAWDCLKLMFPDNGNGSRIILTTTTYELAKSAGHVHNMRSLDEDGAWNLLREKVFKGEPCPSQLENAGKMIAGSCRGHTFSIVVVSGMLIVDQTEAAWDDISENMKLASENVDTRLFEVLSLSYTYLPHNLRPCFLYLAIFPEDEEIHLSKLIKLWVAEGFLNESENKSFEEMGEENVEDLVRRNLVSVSKRKSNGRIKSIAIHYFMRDMCIRLAHTDNFILDFTRFQRFYRQAMKLEQCRRLSSFTCDDDFLEGVYGSTIRTIILNMDDNRFGFRLSIGNVRLLRILDLSNAFNLYLPEQLFELFHLRYLAFDCWFSISESISNLENLQTLIICTGENGRMFDKLPEGIWRLRQLRHLFMFRLELPRLRGAMYALENLQTLSGVADFICSKENLKMMPNLKKLALLYTKNSRDYQLHNFKYLQKLEVLKIEMDWPFWEQTSCAFPPTLKKLNLCGVQLPWKDMKTVASLPNLQVLKLRNHACIGERWETSEGGFSQLTFLLIERSDLKHWVTKSSHYPKLKCLVLHCCSRLLQVPNDIGEIPALRLIQLDELNPSLLSSAKRMQKDR